MSMRLFGNRTGVRWLAAWMAATVVWSVATEAADAGQRDKHLAMNGQRRMAVNIRDFGAKGDGVTDGLTS